MQNLAKHSVRLRSCKHPPDSLFPAHPLGKALEPEVIELVHYFKISDRHARMLNEQLKQPVTTCQSV